MTFHAMTDAEWQDFVQTEDDGPIFNLDNPDFDFDYEYGVTTRELRQMLESARLMLATPDDGDESDDTQS